MDLSSKSGNNGHFKAFPNLHLRLFFANQMGLSIHFNRLRLNRRPFSSHGDHVRVSYGTIYGLRRRHRREEGGCGGNGLGGLNLQSGSNFLISLSLEWDFLKVEMSYAANVTLASASHNICVTFLYPTSLPSEI